jgi:hypothetical protein
LRFFSCARALALPRTIFASVGWSREELSPIAREMGGRRDSRRTRHSQ